MEPGRVTHVLSLGAGVQSSTMALMAARGELTPMPHCAIFADTQNEPGEVYRWLDWLEKQLPFPIYRITKGNLADAALTVHTSRKSGLKYTNANLPVFLRVPNQDREGVQARACTSEFKIKIIQREIRRIASGQIKYWRRHRNGHPPVVQWIGISRDEVMRIKPSRLPYIKNIWPLVMNNITRKDCEKWMRDNGFPPAPRSACDMCPYHSDEEWLRLKRDDPLAFAHAVEFEEKYQKALGQVDRIKSTPFLHRSLLPLNTIDFERLVREAAAEKSKQPDLFVNECEGHCGV